MKLEPKRDRLFHYTQNLASIGRWTFSTSEMREALNLSETASLFALTRAREKGFIATPYRGFHAIVPPDYRSIGCLPAEEFIPHLMKFLGDTYYASLLTAAEYHGAAHQRPQLFQVISQIKHRTIQSGGVRVGFYKSKYVDLFPTEIKNTPRSQIKISTPEATAFDLIVFYRVSGGLSHVSTVLSELAEAMKPGKLVDICNLMSEIQPAQRLGYILDLIGFERLTGKLHVAVKKRARDYAKLHPRLDKAGAEKNQKWKIFVNTNIEVDI